MVALEVVGVSDRLERLRRENRHRFADLLFAPRSLTDNRSRVDPVLAGRSLMGGVMDVLTDWINGDVDASVDEIVEHFTQLFVAVANAAGADEATARLPRRRRER